MPNVKMVRKYLNFDPKCIEMRCFGKKEIADYGMKMTLFDFYFDALSPKSTCFIRYSQPNILVFFGRVGIILEILI